MKLETHHLTPYLQHELRVVDLTGNTETMISIVHTGFNKHIMTNLKGMTCTRTNIEHMKPILRPLSEIKDIPKIWGQFSEYSWEQFETAFLSPLKPINRFDYVSYNIAQLCFEHHLDLFGLIDKGLAIGVSKG